MPTLARIPLFQAAHQLLYLQLCVFDLSQDKCDHTIKTIRACPGKGQNFGNLIPLASDKFTAKIWDMETKKVVRALTGPDEHQVA